MLHVILITTTGRNWNTTFLLLFPTQTAIACSTGFSGGMTIGLVFLDAENFFRFFFNKAKPWARPRWCSVWSEGAVASKLGFESVPLTEPFSSDAGLLLWLWLWLFSLQWELHTESSDRDRPIRRDTLPVFAASISVPHLRLWEWTRFRWNLQLDLMLIIK